MGWFSMGVEYGGIPMNLIPPISLIRETGIGIHEPASIEAEYIKIGNFVSQMLKNQAGMAPTSHVLDVGCGLGRVARPLVDFFTTVSYTGIDIVKESIKWCCENYRDLSKFKFIHADIYNTYYNLTATTKAEDYKFPFEAGSFDVVWSASLFTHLLLPSVDNYLGEMARVLKPGGRTMNTYLLLDEISEPLVLGPRADGRRMPFTVEGGRVANKDRAEHVVGLYKDRILDLHKKHGLEPSNIMLMNWSGGRETKFKGQDLIVAVKSVQR
ncbi:MAG: class I SAM-dependent methyltransferase [Beijerinckiaceae bacterium]|nr:class I SAM-dependent methyltransferase [Beijerinckiaceae bacterium]